MKIGIDGRAAHWYRGTGIGTYTYQLLKNINVIDPINNYHILEPENSSSIIAYKKNFSLSYINTKETSEFWDSINTPKTMPLKDVDIYHVPQNGVGLPLNLPCKKVITLHDIIPLKLPETVGDKYLKIFTEDMPNILSSCQGIITVSNFSKEDIAREYNYPLEKIYVTPLAAEDIYKPLDMTYCHKVLKEKYSITGRFILYVGGFSPRKNILGLIDAFSKLLSKSKSKELKLVITGKKGKSYSLYKQRAQDLLIEDSVIFTGFIPLEDLPIFYNGALLLCYPSFYEGFGLPPLEAMACGTPVIASRATALPEVLGDSALLIDPYDIDELCRSLELLAEDTALRNELSLKGLERSFDFNWNKTALSTINAYKEI